MVFPSILTDRFLERSWVSEKCFGRNYRQRGRGNHLDFDLKDHSQGLFKVNFRFSDRNLHF